MSEVKTKIGFTVIQMVEIPAEYLRPRVLKELKGREMFIDNDEELGEQIFSGEIFEAIACEQAEIEDGHPFKLGSKDIAQIDVLAEDLGEYELIRITKI